MRLAPTKHDKLKRARGELKAGVLPELIGYRLRVAQQAVFRDFASQVGELSPGRAGIMLLIEANPGVRHERRVAARLTDAERAQLLFLLGKLTA